MATYLVTGATGFIGGQLVSRLLERKGTTILALVREESVDRLQERIREQWRTTSRRVQPLVGDISKPRLGLSAAELDELKGTVDHVIHLAAVYDITADAEAQHVANIEGTRHVVQVANRIRAGRLHHVSSIAAAGMYPGTFTEAMLDEATGLDDPYLATKHESERLARSEAKVPWRVYRPGMVVGSSKTGEIDKIDGPYYVFKLIQRLRRMLPMWFPLVGIEAGPLPLVPVDYVVAAMDHIIHLDDTRWDGEVFHLVDPDPPGFGETLNLFARAAHAPQFQMRIDARAGSMIPKGTVAMVSQLPPVKKSRAAILGDLDIPEEVLKFMNWRTTYDCANTSRALNGSGIECPPLDSYAYKLWDYWERNLDPDLFRDRSLTGAIGDRRVMVTGASDGIGKQLALDCARAGAHVLLVARTREKLETVRDEIEADGGTASVHPADLSDMDDIVRMADEVLEEHGGIDVLVNNAGRSIRRSVKLSYDRFHDYERTMQLNYFGAVRLILKLLPAMTGQRRGHIINISSIGVQTNTPRFSAYVASKSALDAFSRCIASEVIDDNVHLTNIHMPLVRTAMIAPTKMYDYFPAISVEEASTMITDAMIDRPKKVGTGLGNFGEVFYAIAPKVVDQILHQAYKLFPDSAAAKGDDKGKDQKASTEGVAFAHLLKGIHW
jgi:NAD(P)-dependent dehydrogenase (short-subunit alcohol dehydrogenase family)